MKKLLKLFIKAVYGKSLEYTVEKNDIRQITHWKNIGKRLGAEGLIAIPSFKSISLFKSNIVGIQLDRLNDSHNKLIYEGSSDLELLKTVMYEFFYDVIKKEFGDKATLLYKDTDSLIIQIEINNLSIYAK